MPTTQDSKARGSLFAEELVSLDALESNTVDLAIPVRGFMVNTAGNVVLNDRNGNTFTLTVAAGVVYPIAIFRIWATGTTASGITGLY
jgi:hypothetical protein